MDEVEKIVVETSDYSHEWKFYHQKQRSDFLGTPITMEYIASVPIPDGIGGDQEQEIREILNGLCKVFTFVLKEK